jgi:hypothetical protein
MVRHSRFSTRDASTSRQVEGDLSVMAPAVKGGIVREYGKTAGLFPLGRRRWASEDEGDASMEEEQREKPQSKGLQALIDEYCDVRLGRVEWSPEPDKLRWDYLSRRGERLRGGGWVARFRGALADCIGDLDVQVTLPMETRVPAGPWGCGSWYWADSDAGVFGMLRARGAAFPFPQFGDGGRRSKLDNGLLVRFFLFCPPGLAEPVLGDLGISLDDVDFSDADVMRLLKISGNAHAFAWLRDNRPDCLDVAQFDLGELRQTPLLEPLLEGATEESVCVDGVVDEGVRFAKRKIAAGAYAEALDIVRALKLREAHAVELLAILPSKNDVQAEALRGHLTAKRDSLSFRRIPPQSAGGMHSFLSWDAEFAAEFLAFARKGDTASMGQFMTGVGGGRLPGDCSGGGVAASAPREHLDLWHACVERLDAELLEFLVSHGLNLRAVLAVGKRADESSTLVRSVANVCDRLGCDAAIAREFLLVAIDAGTRFDGNGSREIMQVMCLFVGDDDLFERLCGAGFSFHVRDCEGGEGQGDARVVNYLLSDFHKRVTSEWDSPAVLEDKEPDWAGVAYALNHGAVLQLESGFADRAKRTLASKPNELAELAMAVPPSSIQPISFVIDVVAKLGNASVLDVLRSWESSFDDSTLRDAIDVCAQRELTEATAYLMNLAGDSFSLGGPSLEL